MTVFYGKKTLPPNKRGELIPLPPFIDKRPVDYLPNLEEKIQRKFLVVHSIESKWSCLAKTETPRILRYSTIHAAPVVLE